MSITVGLDFGTHQTKICIQDATNPNQKTYEFFDFSTEGKSTFFLPSVVQINEDGTVSYGVVNEVDCKKLSSGFLKERITDLQKPILGKIIEPEFIELPLKPIVQSYPDKPRRIPYPEKPSAFADTNDWKSKLLALKNKMLNRENSNVDEWREECRKIDNKYSKILTNWQLKCKNIDDDYDQIFKDWESDCKLVEEQNKEIQKEFEEEKARIDKKFESENHQYNFKRNQFHYLTIDEDGKVTEEKLIFHYFKFALYSKEVNWLHQIDPEIISIWYVANILFLLREKYGVDFYIQMGIPCGIEKKFHESQKTMAVCTLIASYNLVEKYQDHTKFLSATFNELLKETVKINSYSEDDIFTYGVNAIPEAYAGLVSLTQKKKLEKGMNLLVDIGGGTTDIAFFTITEDNLPDIHSVHSLFKGLNYIYENVASTSNESDIVKIQQIINTSHNRFEDFENSISLYKNDLQKVVRDIIGSIKASFIVSAKNNGLNIGHLNEAMLGRPIIYSGGGSTFDSLINGIGSFSDTLRISKESLSISTLKSDIQDDNLFSILSTSYGLSIPLENEINLTDVSNLFDHIDTDINDQGTEYDHGLTDY
jgi:hypothetical protein